MFQTVRTISRLLIIFAVSMFAAGTVVAGWHQLHDHNSALGATLQNETKTVERRYAPDRKVDILHITIDVTPDFKARTVAGTTTINFTPITKPLTELRLDATDLSVSCVTSSAEIADYSTTDKAITITFDPPVPVGDKATVTIAHETEPKRGLYFRTPQMGYKEEDTHLFTQGESHQAPYWYPNYDYPNDALPQRLFAVFLWI